MVEKCVIVIEPGSSGLTYVHELVAKGYKVILMSNLPDSKFVEERWKFFFEEEYIPMAGIKDVKDALERIKGYDVKAVFPGHDLGVILSDQLNDALGLPGNDPKTTWLRNTKFGMHTALKKANLRAIETRKVTSEEQIVQFWDEYKPNSVVIKPSFSASNVGYKRCFSVEESIHHWKKVSSEPNYYGDKDNVIIIQEFIDGKEYVVDTMSCGGRHKVTDVHYYDLFEVNGGLSYDTVLIRDPAEFPKDLIDYALKVLDATDFKNGICHTELMIDKKGPVLIETNPRMMGTWLGTETLRRSYGRTYTEYAMMPIESPEKVDEMLKSPYHTDAYRIDKSIYCMEDMEVDIKPLTALIKGLRSWTEAGVRCGMHKYLKTSGYDSIMGTIHIISKSREQVIKDRESLRMVETKYPGMMVEYANKSKNTIELFDFYNRIFNEINSSSKATISSSEARNFPYGAEGIEMLCLLADLDSTIEKDGGISLKRQCL